MKISQNLLGFGRNFPVMIQLIEFCSKFINYRHYAIISVTFSRGESHTDNPALSPPPPCSIPIMTYKGRPCPKQGPSSGVGCMKG